MRFDVCGQATLLLKFTSANQFTFNRSYNWNPAYSINALLSVSTYALWGEECA